ncbi:class I SAM-dependent methyltransferase [Sphingomonas jatrophae]|uniref:Methyltransferase domain-containing protein n=1 Tax=Sphingomonas jatrophae TaxID=1166337 RepID=A0A1I6M5L7_9SPHN|nr:class I SAM-dependent methyltransferase [Sphingomonas jatrophae]SFS11015.1 Methyltransferase domain-containing protein [Sphingomonas jatrophae]
MMPATPGFEERDACPLCHADRPARLYAHPYAEDPVRSLVSSAFAEQGEVDWALLEGAEFVVDRCRRCDLIYQRWAPNDALMEIIYTRMIGPAFLEAYERQLLTIDNFQRIAGEFATLFEQLGKAPADITMLDFGMGQGRYARVARAMGATVYATEIGDDKKRMGRSLGIEVIDDAAIDGMAFDLVHTEQVLEHLTHPGRDIARLAQAVAPGGLFKIAVPYRGRLGTLLPAKGMPRTALFAEGGARAMPGDAEAFGAIQPLEHLNAYGPETIAWLAAANGLKVVAQTRRRSVSIDTAGPRALARGTARLAAELAKAAMRHRIGYYLLRRPA